jgi:anti-sigma regulatory factor (Ser/Thr protein kinase)
MCTSMLERDLPATVREIKLEPTLEAPREARRFLARRLTELGCPDLVHDAEVILTELVTNAVVHGKGPIIIECAISADRAFIMEVGDSSPRLAVAGEADMLDDHGRGLIIVATLADACGTRLVDGGKITWARLNLPACSCDGSPSDAEPLHDREGERTRLAR